MKRRPYKKPVLTKQGDLRKITLFTALGTFPVYQPGESGSELRDD